ncbi:MAG: MBL fold metallo-hydrolase [Labilithrix sp.]|nr:MBL fold metallo-hydrolase [Labilithrix sp.]MCW5814813.1 MBL fold metallo-hydrolase [Labilithrix sp.]
MRSSRTSRRRFAARATSRTAIGARSASCRRGRPTRAGSSSCAFASGTSTWSGPVPRRKGLALLAAVALALPALPACRIGSAGLRGVGALFASPRKVTQNKTPTAKDTRLGVLWVGHATALVQIDDKVILTDPVFTSVVGQVASRLVEPGIDPKDVPKVDAVLVSHMHFDHFSYGSLELIEDKVKALLLPRNGSAYLPDNFAFPAWELHTWQAWEKDGLRVTAVPVDHVGFRYGIDGAWMKSSFTGYVVEYHGMKVYFGGDSAYDQRNFVETAQRFPKIDVALLPIAPIEPRDFMRRTHMDPREALQAFVDLEAASMVPIHYDTFVNSTDTPGDALKALAQAQKDLYVGPGRAVTPLAIGERRVFVKAGEGPPLPEPPKPEPEPPPALR